MAGVLDVSAAGWSLRDWDSGFFGVRIGQVESSCTPSRVAAAVRDAETAGVDCLYFLVDAADPEMVRAAEANGFALVDVRLTLRRDLDGAAFRSGAAGGPPVAERRGGSSGPPASTDADADSGELSGGGIRIRAAIAADVSYLQDLARVSHRNTRFHRDLRFDSARSDELYAVWIARSVAGELAEAVWVVEADGRPRGYLTLRTDGSSAVIGLVAVDTAFRGRRLGDALVRTAIAWAERSRLSRVSVVTQGSSAAAVRFYERAGFVADRVELWYHRWRDDSARPRS